APYPVRPRLFPARVQRPLGGCGFLPQALPRRAIPCAVSCLLSPRRDAMRIHTTQPLFAWGHLEDHPTLVTLPDFPDPLPHPELLAGLEAARGKGRADYPVARLWGVVLLTIARRHVSFNACLAELHRNPALCRLLGIATADDIPHGWNLSRFLDVLGQEPHLTALRQLFDTLARRRGTAGPDLGPHPARDPTG